MVFVAVIDPRLRILVIFVYLNESPPKYVRFGRFNSLLKDEHP